MIRPLALAVLALATGPAASQQTIRLRVEPAAAPAPEMLADPDAPPAPGRVRHKPLEEKS
jgi:hypothetical protein